MEKSPNDFVPGVEWLRRPTSIFLKIVETSDRFWRLRASLVKLCELHDGWAFVFIMQSGAVFSGLFSNNSKGVFARGKIERSQ